MNNTSTHPPSGTNDCDNDKPLRKDGVFTRIKTLIHGTPDTSLREAIEEYIIEPEDNELDPVAQHEKALFSNILKLRDIPVERAMIPRADIVAIDISTSREELLKLLSSKQFSRIPVYDGTLDEVLGTIHLKDIIGALARGDDIILKDLLTDIPIVSPFMPLLDLLMTMRESRRHMALAVDEFGGIDGLITIGDVIESIVGEIDDEHDVEDATQVVLDKDGTVLVDARMLIADFENEFQSTFTDEDRDESDTLGGLVFALAGRVPVRGEVIRHESGLIFEIIDADRRRVKRIKVRNVDTKTSSTQD